MTLVHRLWVLLFLVALCAGCSIEKRVHRGGYYIQWHKRHGHTAGQKETSEKKGAVAAEATEEEPEDTLVAPPVAETEVADTVVADPVQQPEHAEEVPKPDRKFEPVGVLSAKLLAVPIVLALLDDQAETHQQSFWLSVAFLLLLCLCLFLGTVSMVRYLRNPRAYKFNIWAILAIVIPLALFVVVLSDMGDVF